MANYFEKAKGILNIHKIIAQIKNNQKSLRLGYFEYENLRKIISLKILDEMILDLKVTPKIEQFFQFPNTTRLSKKILPCRESNPGRQGENLES